MCTKGEKINMLGTVLLNTHSKQKQIFKNVKK